MNILALDLGTYCGYAWGDTSGSYPKAGTWHLATDDEVRQWGKARLTRRLDPRPGRLYAHLCALCADNKFKPDVLVFEDVEFQTYTKQTQLWASFRTIAWMFVSFSGIRHSDCVPVSTLKLYATGYGGANKERMKKSLLLLTPKGLYDTLDDNAIDAIWIWKWAKDKLGRLKP